MQGSTGACIKMMKAMPALSRWPWCNNAGVCASLCGAETRARAAARCKLSVRPSPINKPNLLVRAQRSPRQLLTRWRLAASALVAAPAWKQGKGREGDERASILSTL